jgi:2-(3-amino-3-carboxypropyl)histidine synthase
LHSYIAGRRTNYRRHVPMSDYDFELERVAREARGRGARALLIQAPDGLKQHLAEFYGRLEAMGFSPIISADPCYGGCDLAEGEARSVGADMIVHIGHHRFSEGEGREGGVPTMYVPAAHIADLRGLAAKAAGIMAGKGFRAVGLVANTQHLPYIGEFAKALEAAGVRSVVDGRTGGLVLGCRTAAATAIEGEVDALLFIGGGDFHALGVANAVEKEVYAADPYRGEVKDMAPLKKRELAKRWWAIMEAMRAKTFGVVVVAKSGQLDAGGARSLKARLEGKGRRVFMIAAREASWERLSGFAFADAIVVTGCPRVAPDNQASFPKPVLNMQECEELLKRL